MQSSVHDMDHSLLILTNAELIPDCQIEGKVGINWCYVGNEISCATIGGEPPIEVTPEDKDYYKGALGLDDRGAWGPLFEDPAAVLICQTSAQCGIRCRGSELRNDRVANPVSRRKKFRKIRMHLLVGG